jgi:hypothetical protein
MTGTVGVLKVQSQTERITLHVMQILHSHTNMTLIKLTYVPVLGTEAFAPVCLNVVAQISILYCF